MGVTERAVNYFIETQCEVRLKRENITDKDNRDRVRDDIRDRVNKVVEELGGKVLMRKNGGDVDE